MVGVGVGRWLPYVVVAAIAPACLVGVHRWTAGVGRMLLEMMGVMLGGQSCEVFEARDKHRSTGFRERGGKKRVATKDRE